MKQHDCDIYIFQSINHEMYLQLVQKSTLNLMTKVVKKKIMIVHIRNRYTI